MRAWKATLLFFPLLGLAVFIVYIGVVAGKMMILFASFLVAESMKLTPITPGKRSRLEAIITIILILFGLLLAHLSAIRVTGRPPRSAKLIVKGVWSCLIAGMIVGIGWLMSFLLQFPARIDVTEVDVVELILDLDVSEASILPIGIGIMLYYFFAALRKAS